MALIPQDPEIFATTILENITIGAKHSMETVRHYSDLACFTDVALKLPKGFKTSIKEKGVNLSGGQKQCLALARGLLASQKKEIILLDEPTSSLDATTEAAVYRNIFREFDRQTVISTVHRLHLLPMFDRIFMFSNGKIVGSGSVKELLRSCPEFQDLWNNYHSSSSHQPVNV